MRPKLILSGCALLGAIPAQCRAEAADNDLSELQSSSLHRSRSAPHPSAIAAERRTDLVRHHQQRHRDLRATSLPEALRLAPNLQGSRSMRVNTRSRARL